MLRLILCCSLIIAVQNEGISEDFQALMKKHFPDSKVLDEVLVAMKKRMAEKNVTMNGTLNANDFPFTGRHSMDEMSNFFAQLMNCAYGWCSYRCCGVPMARPIRPEYNPPSSYPVVMRTNPTTMSSHLKSLKNKKIPVHTHRLVQERQAQVAPQLVISRQPPVLPVSTPLVPVASPQFQQQRRRPAVACPKACQPNCMPKCLKRYNEIVYEFMNSLTQTDIMGLPSTQSGSRRSVESRLTHRRNSGGPYGGGYIPDHGSDNQGYEWTTNNGIEESPWAEKEPWLPSVPVEEDRPLCRPDCMPLCMESCIVGEPRKQCRPTCMPHCSPACLDAPPLMVPCTDYDRCFCPAGYVQCSESTCCMRYRSMAVRYKDKLAAYRFSDDEQPNVGNNETTVYVQALRGMGGDKDKVETMTKVVEGGTTKELPNNATIIFYPEKKKAEIVMNDGEVLVEEIN